MATIYRLLLKGQFDIEAPEECEARLQINRITDRIQDLLEEKGAEIYSLDIHIEDTEESLYDFKEEQEEEKF